MIAETAFNVFSELSESEKQRFFKMCGVIGPKSKKPKKKPILSDTEAREMILQMLRRTQTKNLNKK